jgi:hypothetical protein
VITDVQLGKRPPRPTDPSRNRWLQDRVWGMITTCWSHKPEQRYKLPTVYHIFSGHDWQEDQPDVKRGNLNTHHDGELMIAERSQTLKQNNGSVGDSSHGSPLSSSFCESRSQKLRGVLVKWIRLVILPSLLRHTKPNMSCSVSEIILFRIGNA